MNKRSIAVMNWRNRTKQKLVEYKGGKCVRCGYHKPIWSAYDFHHLDPNEKDFSISGKSLSFEKLKLEVDKCDVLCKTCHAEVHWEEIQERRIERLKFKRVLLEDKQCEVCGQTFSPNSFDSKFCNQSCTKLAQRKVARPSKDILQEDLTVMTWVAVGRKYNVSDNTIRKWSKSYGII